VDGGLREPSETWDRLGAREVGQGRKRRAGADIGGRPEAVGNHRFVASNAIHSGQREVGNSGQRWLKDKNVSEDVRHDDGILVCIKKLHGLRGKFLGTNK